jgi:hypothetical protein
VLNANYDPESPWGGYGSPCGDLRLQRSRAEQHALYPCTPAPVDVSFPDLADCRECDMCRGCEVHDDCATDWNHITWFAQFAGPGEPACDSSGAPGGRPPKPCALPAGHGGDWHRDRRGNGWPT